MNNTNDTAQFEGLRLQGTHVAADHEIETFSGIFIDLLDPYPEDIVLEDIAHALSNTCRFGGFCDRFYSVAEHAALVARRLEVDGHKPSTLLRALHHDDAEAYLGDIPRPLKPLLGEKYEKLTQKMDNAIQCSLGLPEWHEDTYIRMKEADEWALSVEAKIMLPSAGRGWFTEGLDEQIQYDVDLGLKPEEAETLFLYHDQRYRELIRKHETP